MRGETNIHAFDIGADAQQFDALHTNPVNALPEAFDILDQLPIYEGVSRVEAGSENVRLLPLAWTFELTQIRREYDEEALAELDRRMPEQLSGETLKVNQINPSTVNVVDEEHAVAYLNDHNFFHRSLPGYEPILLEDIPCIDGLRYLVVNGHTRRRVNLRKQQRSQIDPESYFMACTIKTNLSFLEAKPEQYMENTSTPVPPENTAEEIELTYKFLRDTGRDYSVAALQKHFRYKEQRIRDALKFVTAPDEIKKFINKGLSYTNIVDLVKLRDAYETRQTCRGIQENDLEKVEKAVEKAKLEIIDYFETRLRKRLQSRPSSAITSSIRAQIQMVRDDSRYQVETLMIYDEEAEKSRARELVQRDMGDLAIQTLVYLKEKGKLTEDQLLEIEAITDSTSATLEIERTEPTLVLSTDEAFAL